MSDGMVTKWVRKFNEGRDNVHEEPRSGRPSVVNAATFYEEGLQKLVPRYDKCLNNGGNYVEK
jgi:transposase